MEVHFRWTRGLRAGWMDKLPGQKTSATNVSADVSMQMLVLPQIFFAHPKYLGEAWSELKYYHFEIGSVSLHQLQAVLMSEIT